MIFCFVDAYRFNCKRERHNDVEHGANADKKLSCEIPSYLEIELRHRLVNQFILLSG
jgi:hypothetical protein